MADIRRKNVTASVSATQFVEGSHLFKISGYSLLLENNSNGCIQSAPFEVGGHMWAVNYYPQYYYGPQSSVYVVLLSEGTKAMAKFKFYLLNHSGNFDSVKPHDDDHVLFTFADRGVEMGHDLFVKNSDMLSYLQDDCFTIKCMLHVLTSSVKQDDNVPAYREEDPWKICSDLGKLLDCGDGADVVFDVRGGLFRAHKCILAARSQYFRAKFFGPLGKSEGETAQHIKVEDTEPAVIRAFLRYIYTNSFPEIERPNIDVDGAQHSRIMLIQNLILVADQYLVDHLKSICEDLLQDELTDLNVVTFLALAEKHNCYQLKIACLDHLSDPGSLAIAMLTNEFSQMVLDCPSLLKDIKDNTSHQTLEKALSELQDSHGLVSETT